MNYQLRIYWKDDMFSNKKNKKILIVNRQSAYEKRGGDTVVMDNLFSMLKKRGFDVEIDITGQKDFSQYDLIHIFNFDTPDWSTKMGKKAKEAGTPFVVTTLSTEVSSFLYQSFAISKFLINYQSLGQDKNYYNQNWFDAKTQVTPCKPFDNKWLSDNASALIASGESEKESLLRIYNASSPIYIAHFGLNAMEEGNANRFLEKYRMKDFIFCVGRLEQRKNQLMLLKAFEDLDFPIVFAGGGFTYDPEYANAVKNFKRPGKTVVLDRISSSELADAYCACKVHCLPSFFELPGLVHLEAGYHGANVVASDTGTTKDYLKNYCYYCDPYSPESIKEATLKALYAPKNQELKNFVKAYTWERYIDETLSIYEKVFEKESKFSGVKDFSNIQNEKENFEAKNFNNTQSSQSEKNNSSKLFSPFKDKITEAQNLAKNKKYQDGLDILLEIEKSGISDFEVFRAIGAIELARENIPSAREYFIKSLMINNKDARTLSGLGICALRQNDIELATQTFKNSLNEDPYQVVTILELMECAYLSEKYDDIKNALEIFLQRYPDNIDMQFSYAGILYKIKDYDNAMKALKIVEESKPFYTGIQDMKSKIQEEMNSQNFISPIMPQSQKTEIIQSKETIFTDGISTLESIDEKLAIIDELKKTRNYDEFEKEVEELFYNNSLNSEHREVINILKAECLMLHGDNQNAIELLDKVLDKNPRAYKAICNKGIIFLIKDDVPSAIECFNNAISINPKCDVAYSGLGMCSAKNNENEKAFDYYYKSSQCNPENQRAVYGMIEFAYKLSRLEELEKALNSYLEFHPADVDFLYSLAACQYAMGKMNEALNVISKIFIFNPEYKNAIELKSLIAEKLNMYNSYNHA